MTDPEEEVDSRLVGDLDGVYIGNLRKGQPPPSSNFSQRAHEARKRMRNRGTLDRR